MRTRHGAATLGARAASSRRPTLQNQEVHRVWAAGAHAPCDHTLKLMDQDGEIVRKTEDGADGEGGAGASAGTGWGGRPAAGSISYCDECARFHRGHTSTALFLDGVTPEDDDWFGPIKRRRRYHVAVLPPAPAPAPKPPKWQSIVSFRRVVLTTRESSSSDASDSAAPRRRSRCMFLRGRARGRP